MKQFTVTALVNYTSRSLWIANVYRWCIEHLTGRGCWALIYPMLSLGERGSLHHTFVTLLGRTFNFAALIYVLKVQVIKLLVHDKASEGQFLLVHCCMQHADVKPTTPFASVWIKPTTCSQHQKNVVGILRHRCFKTSRSHRECMVNHASCLQFFQ